MTTIATPASAVARWVRSPLARFLVPRGIRQEIAAMLAVEKPAVEHLTTRPEVGLQVRLLADAWFLRERHGAVPGSIGTVVAHSQLNREDNGVLVDWGNGTSVRCDLDELAPAS